MNPGYFDTMPIGVILLFITIFMLAFCEAGFQVGAHFRKKQDKEAAVSLSPLLGGLLGMLAFVLAITFSIAASQHNLRKENVILEAKFMFQAPGVFLAEFVAPQANRFITNGNSSLSE